MTRPAPADLQRWSQEVARDPGSPVFLPLAQAYRKAGHREAAIRLCVRGLEKRPELLDAHALLGRLYLETGDRQRAADEWATVLRHDPAHFEALRGLGFFALERGDFDAAQRHLAAAAGQRPDDVSVREALGLALARARAAAEAASSAAAQPAPEAPVREDSAATASTAAAGVSGPRPDGTVPDDVLQELADDPAVRWALLVDAVGYVMAATQHEDARADERGAWLGGLAAEARRAAGHLDLGEWQGLVLESDAGTVQISHVAADVTLLLGAAPDAPHGSVLRAGQRAGAIVRRALGERT